MKCIAFRLAAPAYVGEEAGLDLACLIGIGDRGARDMKPEFGGGLVERRVRPRGRHAQARRIAVRPRRLEADRRESRLREELLEGRAVQEPAMPVPGRRPSENPGQVGLPLRWVPGGAIGPEGGIRIGGLEDQLAAGCEDPEALGQEVGDLPPAEVLDELGRLDLAECTPGKGEAEGIGEGVGRRRVMGIDIHVPRAMQATTTDVKRVECFAHPGRVPHQRRFRRWTRE